MATQRKTATIPDANDLRETYGTHGEHRRYPRSDWKYEVASDDTHLGYWEWVANQIEAEE